MTKTTIINKDKLKFIKFNILQKKKSYLMFFVFFKLFEKYNIDNLQALISNYFISALLSLLLSENDNIQSSIESEWFIHAIILGTLFISIFNIYALGIQKIGIATSSVINKMSFVVLLYFQSFFMKMKFSLSILFGVLLALLWNILIFNQ